MFVEGIWTQLAHFFCLSGIHFFPSECRAVFCHSVRSTAVSQEFTLSHFTGLPFLLHVWLALVWIPLTSLFNAVLITNESKLYLVHTKRGLHCLASPNLSKGGGKGLELTGTRAPMKTVFSRFLFTKVLCMRNSSSRLYPLLPISYIFPVLSTEKVFSPHCCK